MKTPSEKSYLLAYYATLALVGLMAGCLGPSLGDLAKGTGVSLKSISLVLALRPAGYMLGALLSGRLLDKIPGHPFLAGALLLGGAMLFGIPRAPGLSLLSALVFVMGLADGMLDVGANTLLGWVYGSRLGPFLNGMHFVFAMGALTAPLLIGRALASHGGLHFAYAAMGVAALPIMWLLLRVPSPPIPESVEESGSRAPWKLTLNIWLVFFLYGACEASFGGWISSYASALHLADMAGAAYLTSLFWASFGLGRLSAIALALRVGPRWILSVDVAGMILSLGLMLVMPGSKPALVAGCAGAGFFMASFFPTLLAYAGSRLSPKGRVSGVLISLFFLGSSGGSIVIPWLIGQGFESIGPWVAMAAILGASIVIAGLLIPLFLPKSQSEKAFPA